MITWLVCLSVCYLVFGFLGRFVCNCRSKYVCCIRWQGWFVGWLFPMISNVNRKSLFGCCIRCMVTWLVSHSEGIFGGAAFGIQNRTTPSEQSRYTQTIQNKHPPKQSRYTKNNPHPNNPNIHRQYRTSTHPNNPNIYKTTLIQTIQIYTKQP